MSSINIGELAAELTYEQLVELCARHFLVSQLEFAGERAADHDDETMDDETRLHYRKDLFIAESLISEAHNFVTNIDFEADITEKIEEYAIEFVEPVKVIGHDFLRDQEVKLVKERSDGQYVVQLDNGSTFDHVSYINLDGFDAEGPVEKLPT